MNRNRKYFKKSISGNEVSVEEVRAAAAGGQKIELIKLYRRLSGLGLKDSKDAVEAVIGNGYQIEPILKAFDKAGDYHPELSKEQFMNLIEAAVDNKDTYYFKDYLDAVEMLCKNIRSRGGLEVIAEEFDKFIEQL